MFAASKAVVSLAGEAKTGFERCAWLLIIESAMLLKVYGRLEGRGPKMCRVRCVCVAAHALSGLTFSMSTVSDVGPIVSTAFAAFLSHGFVISPYKPQTSLNHQLPNSPGKPCSLKWNKNLQLPNAFGKWVKLNEKYLMKCNYSSDSSNTYTVAPKSNNIYKSIRPSNPTLLIISCVMLRKLLNLDVPQFPYL